MFNDRAKSLIRKDILVPGSIAVSGVDVSHQRTLTINERFL